MARLTHHKQKHITKTKSVPKHFFDYVVYFFTIATPLFELPQAITIYSTHNAESVSLTTWSFFLLDNIIWIIYALKRRIMPLLISTILYLLFELLIVVGILLYS
jgi:uncharacterized protein with PQ loop repeat